MAKNIRERAEKRAQEKDTRPQATARYIRMSPSKVNRVLKLIRRKTYQDAKAILEMTPNTASEEILKVLNSAAANAEHNNKLLKEDLVVAHAVANNGPILKRMMPRAKGSGDRILKRTCHINIILDTVKGE